MRRLYRMTLQMPEMDSTGQSAPICVSLTSSWLKEAPHWPIKYSPYSYKTFYTKALEYEEYFTHIAFQKMTKSLENIQLFSICRTECLAKR